MTENNYNKLIDAICELVNLAYDATTSKEEFERLDNAGADIIDCLEEIQQYRAIGTIEEFKALKEKNETLKALYKDARKEGNNLLARTRNNAIDEYMTALCDKCLDQKNECYQLECPFCDDGCDIVNIAEKLKVGGENEID